MKKLLYLFIAGALFACSSSTQLSNFSKQKYTKKFHHKSKKYNDVIDEYANEFKSTKKLNEYTISHKTPNTKFSNLYKPVFKEITTKKRLNKANAIKKSKQKLNNNTEIITNNNVLSLEQFSFKNQVKNEILNNKKSSNKSKDVDTLLLIIIAIFIPPLAVALYEGITTNFWIDLLLTLLFFIPGLIYAIIVITG